MTGTTERLVLAHHLPNTRDLGGLVTANGAVVRHRRLLRTAALSPLAATVGAELSEELGPAVYVDLRTDPEIARVGEPTALIGHGWKWRRVPLLTKHPGDTDESPDGFLRRYLDTLPRYLRTVDAVIDALGEHPTLVGCAAGKDRTGLVVALILYGLGVPREVIVEDFVVSTWCFQRYQSLSGSHPAVLAPAYPEVIDAVLDRVDHAALVRQVARARGVLLEEPS